MVYTNSESLEVGNSKTGGYNMSKPKLALVLAIVTVLVFSAVAAVVTAEKKKEQSRSKVNLELIWEKEFQEAVIDFSIAMSKSGEYFPNVVVLTDKALVLDHRGEKISEIRGLDKGFNFFTISESGNHIIQSWQYRSQGAKELEQSIVYVYDLAGTLRWKTPNVVPMRFPELAPNGDYLIGPSWAEVLLVKKDGALRLINPRQDERRSLMRIFFAISGDSKFWAISFGEPYQDENVELVIYDPNGDELWRKVLEPMGLAYELEISHNGDMIATVAPGRATNFLCLFDRRGNLLWKAGEISGTNQRVVFSASDDYVFIADAWGAVKCFATSSGRLIWHDQISKEEIVIFQDPGNRFVPHMEISFCPDGNSIIISGRNMKTNADCLLVFEGEGGLVRTFSLPSSTGRLLPKTKFVPTGEYIYAANGERLSKFALRRAK